MKPERIKQLRELCDGATRGPWRYDDRSNSGKNWLLATFGAWERWPGSPREETGDAILTTDNVRCSQMAAGDARGDAEFCAAARTAIPELLDEVERLRDEVERADSA